MIGKLTAKQEENRLHEVSEIKKFKFSSFNVNYRKITRGTCV